MLANKTIISGRKLYIRLPISAVCRPHLLQIGNFKAGSTHQHFRRLFPKMKKPLIIYEHGHSKFKYPSSWETVLTINYSPRTDRTPFEKDFPGNQGIDAPLRTSSPNCFAGLAVKATIIKGLVRVPHHLTYL